MLFDGFGCLTTLPSGECYGSEYFGISEIHLWIQNMLQKQKVLEWTIKRFIHSDDVTTVEWYFKEQQGDNIYAFDCRVFN